VEYTKKEVIESFDKQYSILMLLFKNKRVCTLSISAQEASLSSGLMSVKKRITSKLKQAF